MKELPTNFDITFKIKEFDYDNNILVIQYHSKILKNTMDTYPEINLGVSMLDFELDVKEQIVSQCRALILEQYYKENRDEFKEKLGIAFIKENLLKEITVKDTTLNVSSNTPEPVTKLNFL